MRIGQVSKRFGIPVNNIYFYIQYGLIVPPKPGGQYVFDEKTQADLQLLLELKEMDFSLKDIHRILSLFRVSKLEDPQDIDDLRRLYLRQLGNLQEKRGRLDNAVERLRGRVEALSSQLEPPERPSGVPLSMLPLLCCPQCGGDLALSEVTMSQRDIHTGVLACACGYRAAIEDGVVCTPNRNTSRYDKPEVTRGLYKDLPSRLISLFQVSYNWMTARLDRLGTANKVLLESYVNAWFFLHNHQHVLDRSCRLIVLDKFPETLRYFKDLIDRQRAGIDILYIADSGVRPPLRKGTVDIHIDFFAVNEHNFYRHDFWLDHLRPYLRDDGCALGTYFHFEHGHRSMRRLLREYPEAHKQNFQRDFFLESLQRHYHLQECEDVGSVTDSGDNLGFSFHATGEKMHLMPYLAEVRRQDHTQ